MKKWLMVVAACAGAGSVAADVQLEIRDYRGGSSTVSSNGRMARIEDSKMPGYVIVDYGANKIFVVDPQRNEILSAGASGAGGAENALGVSLEDRGGGQKIAGYDTRKYRLVANGNNCGTVYASQKLLANDGVHGMFESMRSMQHTVRGMMGGISGMLSECQRASMQLADLLEAAGAPLKVIDEKGKIISEVVAINTDKSLPANHYQLPPGKQVVDMTQMMNQAAQQTPQMMQQMPDMDEIMQQMQKGGGAAGGQGQEQMQQQLQQLQQMLQQMQQQQQ